jgi:hypothetical protein
MVATITNVFQGFGDRAPASGNKSGYDNLKFQVFYPTGHDTNDSYVEALFLNLGTRS